CQEFMPLNRRYFKHRSAVSFSLLNSDPIVLLQSSDRPVYFAARPPQLFRQLINARSWRFVYHFIEAVVGVSPFSGPGVPCRLHVAPCFLLHILHSSFSSTISSTISSF